MGTAAQGRAESAGLHLAPDNIRLSVNTILSATAININKGINCFSFLILLFNLSHLKSFYNPSRAKELR